MPGIDEAETRMSARKLLKKAYAADVDRLAEEMCARIRRGEFDKIFPDFDGILEEIVRKHPRVANEELRLETICYSANANAVEEDFLRGWSRAGSQPWSKLVVRSDDDDMDFPEELVLPSWEVVAFHAFGRDVALRIRALLGDSPAQYVATRLGVKWDD
jgi:hypothetical protein